MDEDLHVLTPQGYRSVLAILGEFCHGFTIEEVALNSDHTEDEIKTMLMILMEGYAMAAGIDESAIQDPKEL